MNLRNGFVWIYLMLEAVFTVMGKDYYELLGVGRDAKESDIKRAFRKLAMQYHPDRNKDKDAEVKFREIAEAYEILNDSEKRRKYDQYGENAFKDGDQEAYDFDFDMKEFFKHFDESFRNHQHHHHHQQHAFRSGHHFINLDDLWNEDGEAPIFFHEGGFHQESHDGGHVIFDADELFGAFGGGFMHGEDALENFHNVHSHSDSSDGQRCRTVTQRIGNTVTTFTECS